MYIPQSDYAEDYKQLHRLMSAFVKADDELRFADVEDEDLFGLIDNYEITAEAVVEQVNHLRRNVDV